MRKKTKKKLLFYLATKFGWLIILFLGKTIFIKQKGQAHLRKIIENRAKLIFVLWHGRISVPIYVHRKEGLAPMISLHADGEMIAQTVYKLGYRPVRGSSTRGGKKAFYDLVKKIKNGTVGVMIPDGPQGPRHHFKSGTLYLAQLSDAYLLPVTFSANRKIVFNSWDKFTIPLPFSKNMILYGKPIKVPNNSSSRVLVKIRASFEQQMIQLELQADEFFRK